MIHFRKSLELFQGKLPVEIFSGSQAAAPGGEKIGEAELRLKISFAAWSGGKRERVNRQY
jgi:hypothetical protein